MSRCFGSFMFSTSMSAMSSSPLPRSGGFGLAVWIPIIASHRIASYGGIMVEAHGLGTHHLLHGVCGFQCLSSAVVRYIMYSCVTLNHAPTHRLRSVESHLLADFCYLLSATCHTPHRISHRLRGPREDRRSVLCACSTSLLSDDPCFSRRPAFLRRESLSIDLSAGYAQCIRYQYSSLGKSSHEYHLYANKPACARPSYTQTGKFPGPTYAVANKIDMLPSGGEGERRP